MSECKCHGGWPSGCPWAQSLYQMTYRGQNRPKVNECPLMPCCLPVTKRDDVDSGPICPFSYSAVTVRKYLVNGRQSVIMNLKFSWIFGSSRLSPTWQTTMYLLAFSSGSHSKMISLLSYCALLNAIGGYPERCITASRKRLGKIIVVVLKPRTPNQRREGGSLTPLL